MRTQEEIEAQLEHRKQLLAEAQRDGLDFAEDALREQIVTLQWVLGIDQSENIFL